MKFASGPFLCRWEYRGRHRFLTCMFGRLPSKTLKLVGNFCVSFRGGVPIVPPRGTRPLDGRFWQRWRRPGPACGPRRRFCARLLTVLESRPSSAQHSVVGPPVEMMQSAAPRGLAGLQAMRRMTAAEAHRRLVSDCNGHTEWKALAGGGYRRGAGGRHPWARAKPLKGDPAMQLLGQEPLRRGRATGGRQDSCAVHDLRASDGENAPWRQDARAVHSPTALCGAFRMHGAHILPKLAVFEYMQAICCHEPVFSPSEAPSGTHRGDISPRPAAWERIGAISRHGRQRGNASGRYLAMARRRMTATEVHRRSISDCNGDGACPCISMGSARSRMQSLGDLV